jgi:NAD(P)-dependent dehydrogenase (short-subunit alcohol dehydrogenase family)
MRDALLVIGDESSASSALAEALGGDALAVPASAAELEAWRARELGGEPHRRIAIGLFAQPARAPLPIVATSPDDWLARAEDTLVRWTFALGVAAARCEEGGAVVAVVERPAPLDCAGFAPEAAVADGVCALVRSLARSEGARRVRVNAVLTSARTAPAHPIAPPPALASFPGSLAREVAGAVRLLLADDAAGVTGQTLAADCGRTW